MATKYKRHRTFLEPLPSETDSYIAVDGMEFKIADCTTSVTLFFFQSEKEALEKVARLRKALDILERNIRQRAEEKARKANSGL